MHLPLSSSAIIPARLLGKLQYLDQTKHIACERRMTEEWSIFECQNTHFLFLIPLCHSISLLIILCRDATLLISIKIQMYTQIAILLRCIQIEISVWNKV